MLVLVGAVAVAVTAGVCCSIGSSSALAIWGGRSANASRDADEAKKAFLLISLLSLLLVVV